VLEDAVSAEARDLVLEQEVDAALAVERSELIAELG
jgi:hypothetical protein